METGVYVVTGANAGIGKEIAKGLARMGKPVVMVSRDPGRGETAAEEVRTETKGGAVELAVGSLDTVADAKRLAGTIRGRYPRIACLVNNAGVWMTRRILNADGLETTFMVNYLGPFILTNLLLPCLAAAAPARVVNVNAALYVYGRLDLERTPYGHDFNRFRTYCSSKQANLLFTVELARRLGSSGVSVNAVHPGVIRTGLAMGDTRGVLDLAVRAWKRFMKTPAQGAKAPIRLAAAPELEGVTGRFFLITKEKAIREKGKDPEAAARLWELSERLGGFSV
jgi:retinol dehydrogenase-14